jgi:hypothetical protein
MLQRSPKDEINCASRSIALAKDELGSEGLGLSLHNHRLVS